MAMNINNINENKVVVRTSNISKIKIPMIQRDYVQGLNETKLESFLNTLIDTLENNKTFSLDFIYGNINEDGVFEPIDGQQRLTTLALLTFYLYCRRENTTIKNNPFTHITYATRQSAKRFCELLANDELKGKFEYGKIPSDIIKENPKYFSEYDEDITISAMINTLNKIHELIGERYNINELFKNISNINFHIFPMESFNLSDDLYIKMNGRGKQLSNFDNFKAEYFKWLEENTNIIDNLIPNCILQNSTQDKLNTLKRKFDTDYLDIFWNYAFENSTNKNTDTNEAPDPEKLFFNFLKNYIVDKYLILSKKNKNKNSINNSDIIKQINNDSIEYKNLYINLLKQNNYNYILILILEFLSKEYYRDNFLNLIKPIWDTDNYNLNISYIFMNSNITWKNRAVVHTIFIYLEQMLLSHINNFSTLDFNNNNYFSHIMRYIWNIVENHKNLDTDYRLYDLIDNLDNNYYKHNIYEKSIYEIASNNDSEGTYVIKQENLKAKKIFNNRKDNWEQEFINIEKHKYFKGDIYFLINDDLSNNITTFRKRIDMASQLFNKEGLIDELKENNLFIRGILSKFNDNDFNLLKKYSYLYDSYKGEYGFLNNYSHIINNLLDTNENIYNIVNNLKENITHNSHIKQYYINIIHEIIYKTDFLNKLIENKNGYIRTFHNCKINLWGCTSPKGSSSKNYICIDIIKSGIIGRLQKQYEFKITLNINYYTVEYFNETFSFYENFPNRAATFKSKKYPHIELEIANFKYSYEGDVHWNGIIIKNNDVRFEHKIDYDKYMNEITNISFIINNEINTITSLF